MFVKYCTAAAALVLAACLAAGVAAAQDPVASYDLSGITFRDGASATGSFVLDLSSDRLLSWNIDVSTGKFLGATVPAQTFDSTLAGASAQVASIGPQGHDLVFYSSTSGQDFLNLFFSSSLLSSPSFASLRPTLSVDALLTRRGLVLTTMNTSGSPGASLVATPVPEPSAAVLLAAGALVVGATLRRRG